MSGDYYEELYWSGMAGYNAELAAAKSDLAQAQATGDFAGGVAAAQRMANTTANLRAFDGLYREHLASMQPPPAPPPPTREEVAAKPLERMTYQDVIDMSNTSKYCQDDPLTLNDSNVVAGYQHALATRGNYRR